MGSGLPQSFLKPWRAWVDQSLHTSQAALGEEWLPAWLEAPVWFFSCAPGVVGPDAVVGLMFPSVDRAGRHYPMTVAAVLAGVAHAPDPDAAAPWLAAAEAAGLQALMHDLEPSALGASLTNLGSPATIAAAHTGSFWWTAGSPRVVASHIAHAAMPTPASFATMVAGQGDGRSLA